MLHIESHEKVAIVDNTHTQKGPNYDNYGISYLH